MTQRSWHLNRRTALKSTGVCLTLPWMECMAEDKPAAPKKRFFAGYFAYGVPMPADNAPDRLENGWFPLGEGRDYQAPEMHKSIMPLKDKVTFLSGLSHPAMRRTSAHKGADYFLTGANILKTYDKQSISIDQYVARALGNDTRFQSLVMSSFPWATHRIRVLSVERPKPGLVRELQQHQYGYHCSLGRAAWHDEIWVHRPSMPDVQTSRHPMPSQARPCGQNVSAPVVAVLASHPARARGKGSARATHTAYAGAEEKEKASRVRTDAQRVDALLDF